MAESTLSLSWDDFKSEVGYFLGYGRTIANFSFDQNAEVEIVVQSGIRRVYFPPAIQGVRPGYEWSWLRPTTSLYLGASGTDGTVSGDSFDSATFTDWVDIGVTTDDTVDITSVGAGSTTVANYEILSVAAGAITLSSSPGDGTSLTFRVKRTPANYELDDGVSRIVGGLHYAANEYLSEVIVISISRLLEMRASSFRTGNPNFAAIRFKNSDATDGQRQEILFFPEPDAFKVLSFEYEVYQGGLSDAQPFPLGGMKMSELITASCLSVAEQRGNDTIGLNTNQFQLLLVDAIARDQKQLAQNFGQMGGGETGNYYPFRRGYTGSSYPITYNGSEI